ncbi:hypothetical protein E2P81_ATG01134 [Venturia nashicola]|nr:hypothetical protein E2P81_ATG01134 [Venturia nashicola]
MAGKATRISRSEDKLEWLPGMEKLVDWEFHDKVNRRKLEMINRSYSHERHFFKLPDAENPALKFKSREVPQEDRPAIEGQSVLIATTWSEYFTDALYGRPLGIPKPRRHVQNCHIVGLLNGDLIIDATSRLRPGSMYWTLNRETQMLQHIKPCGKRPSGPVKGPEFHMDEVDQYLSDRGPRVDFGARFPPQIEPRILSWVENEIGAIIQFDGRIVVGGQLVPHSRTDYAAAESINGMALAISTAIPAYLDAFSTAIYYKARLTAFKVENRLKRKRQDEPASSTSKCARGSRPEGREYSLGSDKLLSQNVTDVTESVTAALDLFFEALSRSIYESARKAAFSAEMKRRKAEHDIDVPPSKRSCPTERGRFDALREVVGVRMATTVQDLLHCTLRKATAGFRRRKRISWSPFTSKHDANDHGGHRGVLRDTQEPSNPRPESDEDNDQVRDSRNINANQEVGEIGTWQRQQSDNGPAPVSENHRITGESSVDWGGHPPVQRDEDEDEYVIRTDNWISDGKRSQPFDKLSNKNSGDGKDGANGEETEVEGSQDDGGNTVKAKDGKEGSVVGIYDYRNEPPLPRWPNGNEAYECPPERPEDDYMMSGAIGPESPVRPPAPFNITIGDVRDVAKEGATEVNTNQEDDNKTTGEAERPPDEPRLGPNNSTKAANPEVEDAAVADPEPADPEVADPQSPIDQVTLHLIAEEEVELEFQRIVERNIAEEKDPVARERLRREDDARKAIKQMESDELMKSILEDSDNECADFDDSDEEDGVTEEAG